MKPIVKNAYFWTISDGRGILVFGRDHLFLIFETSKKHYGTPINIQTLHPTEMVPAMITHPWSINPRRTVGSNRQQRFKFRIGSRFAHCAAYGSWFLVTENLLKHLKTVEHGVFPNGDIATLLQITLVISLSDWFKCGDEWKRHGAP